MKLPILFGTIYTELYRSLSIQSIHLFHHTHSSSAFYLLFKSTSAFSLGTNSYTMEDSKTTLDGLEKVEQDSLESPQDITEGDGVEYPTKFKLIMIVVALVLSMFLVHPIVSRSGYAKC